MTLKQLIKKNSRLGVVQVTPRKLLLAFWLCSHNKKAKSAIVQDGMCHFVIADFPFASEIISVNSFLNVKNTKLVNMIINRSATI